MSDPEVRVGDVEDLLVSVASGRVTVQRVLEHLRGERPADELDGGDWIATVNHVRRDREVTLAIYGESPDEPAGAAVFAPSRFGAIEYRGWNEAFGETRRVVGRDRAAETVHRSRWDLLPVEVAHDRFEAFVDAHRDVDERDEREVVTDGGVEEVYRRETIQRCGCGALAIGECDCPEVDR